MDRLIKELANTIVANLYNTVGVGLFNGKMGLAIFMYNCARYFDNCIYEAIADQLIDDIYSQINSDISPNIFDGSAGIGFGLSYLIHNHFIEGDSSDVLHDIDSYLLNNSRDALIKDLRSLIPVYSSGLYLLARLSLCDNMVQKKIWVNSIIDTGIFFIVKCVKEKHFEPKLSFINSMLFVLNELPKDYIEYQENWIQLQRDLLLLSMNAIKKKLYQDIDIIIIKRILGSLPKDVYDKRYKCYLEPLLSVDIHVDNIEEWNNDLNWYFIYKMEPLYNFPEKDLKQYIMRKLVDCLYDQEIINNQCSALGMNLINRNYKKQKYEED